MIWRLIPLVASRRDLHTFLFALITSPGAKILLNQINWAAGIPGQALVFDVVGTAGNCDGSGGGSAGTAIRYYLRGPRSNPSPCQNNLSVLAIFYTVLNGQRALFRCGKIKAVREAMANYIRMSYAKNNQDPTPGSPMLGLSMGPIYY
ncbi:hypothetical protein PoB_005909400 [Plakobranchus ocellatus]|uniref:Uncharacterized protein n=1 Tax=Plakobranchus ocellatus TaxID=259542 RepID=A0AAV4CMH3_9GAST|nr:hypothetical protein PoB_005909400 [Plakobranchus ocellatus]